MIYRRAIRAVMLTPEGRVLLMQAQEPLRGYTVWFTPGGAIEKDEEVEDCLRREVEEETGLTDLEIGPLIWHRHHRLEWNGKMFDQREAFYLTPIEQFEPNMEGNPSENELKQFRRFKWWTAQEILESEDEFAPRSLAEQLESLILNGPPDKPIDVGV